MNYSKSSFERNLVERKVWNFTQKYPKLSGNVLITIDIPGESFQKKVQQNILS